MATANRANSATAQKSRLKVSTQRKVEDYLNHLREQDLSIQRAFIFGSHVSGKTHPWSDIDLCVVSPDFGRHNDALSYLWRSLRKKDVAAGIEPIGFHPSDFVDDLPIVYEVLRTGVRIA